MINTSPVSTPENRITIEIPAIKLEIDFSGYTFEAIDQMVFDIAREIGRKIFEQILSKIDTHLCANRPRKQFKNDGFRSKFVQTLVGEIKYRRRLYVDRATKKSCYLLDRVLNFSKDQRMSLKLQKILCTLASVSVYREIQKQLFELLGLNYSHEGIRQQILKEGTRLEKISSVQVRKNKQELPVISLETKPELVIAEVDGTYIHLQNSQGKNSEIKLGIAYTGKQQRYKTGSEKSLSLSDKKVYINIKDTRDKFMDNFSCFVEKNFNMSFAKEQYFGGDGDTWIKNGRDEYFPRAEYILCEYHLHKCIKGGLPHDKELRKSIYKLIDSSDIDKAEELIKNYIAQETDAKRIEKAKDVLAYIINNRAGILSSVKLKKDETKIRAGAIEGNIDKIIAQRFKGRGMSWSLKGASALLKIREKIINKDWERWWYEERDSKIKIIAGISKPLTATQACKPTEAMSQYCIEATLPCYRGPDSNKYWVGIIREATRRCSLGVIN